jgi:RNA polymerase sigma-70 factor (ECF subfamily)
MHPGEDDVSTALESALATFGTMVRRVGWRHRLSDADVDELVQDVRIRLWRARAGAGAVAGGGSEQIRDVTSSYVYRTAVSAALDLLRRRRAHHAEPLEPDDEPGEAARVSEPVGPAEELAQSELAEEIARAVDTIAPARRPVVRMHLAGYPREEIAAMLGWTEAKTRNLLYRGLADLRERLTARGIGWERASDETTAPDDRTATT